MFALLFHPNQSLLGELLFEKGAFRQCVLTKQGHEELDAQLERWQTEGIILQDWLETGNRIALTQRAIPLRSHDCESAFIAWAKRQHLALVELNRLQLEVYQQLSRHPFTPEEQYTLVQSIRSTPLSDMPMWKTFFQELDELTQPKPVKKKKAVTKKK